MMRLLFPFSIPNFKLNRGQLEKPLVIPYDIPQWKREQLINLIAYGLREKDPLLVEINWEYIEKELDTCQHPSTVRGLNLNKKEIIITEIETENQLKTYNRKYNRIPVMLTIAVLKKPYLRAHRKWIVDLKNAIVESFLKAVFEDELLNRHLFTDFSYSFVLQSFEDPIDCIYFLNRIIEKIVLTNENDKKTTTDDEDFLRSTFCEMMADQFAELDSNELKILFSFALTRIPEEISELTSFDREIIKKIAKDLSSKGFVHLYGDSINPTAPVGKLSEPEFFRKIGKTLNELIPEKFSSAEEVYSKILLLLQPSADTFSSEISDISNISIINSMRSINVSAIKDLIKTRISELGLDDAVNLELPEKLRDTCSRILWKEKDDKKRRVLLSARSLAYLIEKNPEMSLKDVSKVKVDEEYVNIFRRLQLENSKLLILQGKLDFSIQILKKTIETSKKIDEIQGYLILQLGTAFSERGEYGEALKLYDQSLKIFEELGDKSGIATTLHAIGNINQDQGNYEEAVKKYNQSLKIAEELGDKRGIASTLHQLGMIHHQQGNYEEAVKKYNQSLKTFEELGDKRGIATTLHQLGMIHYLQGNYEEAVKKYNQSLKTFEELGDKRGIATTLHQLGMIHYQQGNYDEAVKKYNQSLKMKEELGDRSGIATTLHQIGNVHYQQGNYDEAVKKYNQSLKMKEELGDKSGIASTLGQLGMIYEAKEEYVSALQAYIKAFSIFEALKSPYSQLTSKLISELRDKMGEEEFKAQLEKMVKK